MLQLLAQETQLSGPDNEGITGLGGFQPSLKSGLGSVSNAPTQLTKLISVAIGAITIFAGLAFLFYFMIGALGWLTSGGDKQKLDTSRDRITTALIGLVLVIAAYALTGVIGSLVGLNILDLEDTFGSLIDATN